MSQQQGKNSQSIVSVPYDYEPMDCPLCMEEMDPSDLHFRPCPCGYQVCRFCWNRIRQNENEKCPACRRLYTDDAVEFTPLSVEELAVIKAQRETLKKQQQRQQQGSWPGQQQGLVQRREFAEGEGSLEEVLPGRRHLIDVRVTQRNLVYVIGIPIALADEHILKQDDLFGRYGRILKLVVNRRAYSRATGTGAINNAAAYITFSKDEEALKAIRLIDGKTIEGAKLMRATYGTTKYCANFLRGRPCTKSGCLYLHHEVFENEMSTEEPTINSHHSRSHHSSMTVSPPPSPSPLVMSANQQHQHDLDSASDRARTFFDRISKWSRLDELLADLGSTTTISGQGADAGVEPIISTSFDPFADDSQSSIIDGSQLDSLVSARSAAEPVSPATAGASTAAKKIPVQSLFSTAPSAAALPPGFADQVEEETVDRPVDISPADAEPAMPAAKAPASTVQPQAQAPSQTTVSQKEPPVLAPMPVAKGEAKPPKVFTTSQLQATGKKQRPPQPADKKPVSPTPPASKTIDKAPSLFKKTPGPVSDNNLFSVLLSGSQLVSSESESEPDHEEPPVAIPAQSQTAVQSEKKKKKKKEDREKVEDELDALIKELEATTTTGKPKQEKQSPAGSQPAKAKPASVSPPGAFTKTPDATDSKVPAKTSAPEETPTIQEKKPSQGQRTKMEDEAAKRVTELEIALKTSKLEAREIEDRLRESIVAFLHNMSVPTADPQPLLDAQTPQLQKKKK